MSLKLTLCETRCDLREMLKPRRTLSEIPLKPAHRGTLVLRRSSLRVKVDESQRVLEREVRQLSRGILGSPECATLNRTAEADVSVRLGGQERMFS
jgi:hypothetical protein